MQQENQRQKKHYLLPKALFSNTAFENWQK
jgi:hypothetical protein